MSDLVILYRNIQGLMEPKELDAIKNSNFFSVSLRSKVPPNSLVIGRYSTWPFYKELYDDLQENNSRLINSPFENAYTNDLQSWSHDLKDHTPKTYYRLEDVPDGGGPFIVKGQTKSKKEKFLELMYAPTKADAIKIACKLMDDTEIGQQSIYVRDFIKFETLTTAINGQPITKEFRFFVLLNKILCGGYYWSSYIDELEVVPQISEVPLEWLNKVVSLVSPFVNFFTIDVAKLENGDWMVVEINEGQQSGLSEVDPVELYNNLHDALT